ncbi:RNA-binding domain-containing [Lecanosticta acicola]|uniref:RNA-binding domain-containing n=1 Tax=Lecanosticta acicola TaxID=111012 RepID=A0AAI9E8G6_9PEZI|nr:RNA-binding domain-containing [Lecanosticta acicola]
MATSSTRLYLGNLPYVAQKREIVDLLNEIQVQYHNVDFSTDPFSGRNPSYCFVDFANAEDASRAMEMLQGQKIRGRPMKVNFNTQKRTTPSRPLPDFHDPNKEAFVFNRWERNDAKSHWVDPLLDSRRVRVDNLPKISHQDALQVEMRRMFDGFEVQAVSKLVVRTDPWTGRSFGYQHYCFVDLATPDEAERAARELNGARCTFGGNVEVQVARNDHGSTTKVEREQLGFTRPEQRWTGRTAPPLRDFNSSWRRAET